MSRILIIEDEEAIADLEAAIAAEKAKVARLVEALRDIAAQKLATEIQTCADEEQFGDFDGGYDAIIAVARAAIAEVQE